MHTGEEGDESADKLANCSALMPELPERDWEVLEQQVFARLQGNERAALDIVTQPAPPRLKQQTIWFQEYPAGLLSAEELEREMMEHDAA